MEFVSRFAQQCKARSRGRPRSALGRGRFVTLLAGCVLCLLAGLATAQPYPNSLANSAQVSLPVNIADPASGNNTATDTNTLAATAALAITKTLLTPSPVSAGGAVGYEIVVSNAGPSIAFDATVDDVVPPQLSNVSWSCAASSSASSCSIAAGTGTVAALQITIAPGDTITLAVTGTAPSSGTVGANTATVTPPPGTTDPDPGDNTSTTPPVPVAAVADLSLTKTLTSASPAPAGSAVTYRIAVSNAGPSDAIGATIADNVPAELTNVSWTCTAAGTSNCGTPSGTGNAISLSADVGAGAGNTITIDVTGTAPASGTIGANTATVTPPGGTTDPNPGDNTSTTPPVPVAAVADLSLTKTLTSASPAPAGSAVTYRIAVSNAGPSDAIGATIADNVPAELTNVSWTCTAAGTSNCGTPSGTGNAISLSADVGAGAGNTITIDVTGTAPASGTIGANTATATPPGGTTDPNLGDNTSTAPPVPVAAVADLSLTKTLTSASPAPAGSTVTYRIVVGNTGPSDAIGATIADTVPAELTNVSWTCTAAGTSSCGTPSGTGNAISLSADVGAGIGNTVTMDITGTAPASGTIGANTATVTPPGGTTDPNPGDNTGTAPPVPVAAVADLSLTKTLTSASPAAAGSTVTYQIVVSNDGPSDAIGATIGDNVPSELTNVSWTCAASGASSCGTLNGTGNSISLSADIVAGAGNAVTLTVTGTAPLTGTIGANTAIVTPPGGTTDPDPGDNSGTAPPVPVAPRTILANDDNAGPVGGAGGATAVVNVLSNDTLAGAPANLADVTLTPSNAGPITIHPDGNVDIAPNTPAGTYVATYQICENLNPTNCDTATVTVTVAASPIDAADDAGSTTTTGGTAVANVLANDTLNGIAPTASNIALTQQSSSDPNIALDIATGAVTVASGTAPGTYTLTYRICENLNPANCDTATVTVTVASAPIDAADDAGSIATTGGTAVANVLANDTLNGAAPTTSTIALTQQSSSDPNIALDTATGAVTVAPGTPPGAYTLTYRICENLAPTNCDTATVAITVTATPIVANDDTAGPIDGASGATSVANVLANDTLAGAPVVPADITLTPTNAGPITINTDGTVDVAPNTPAGTYTATYQICENANPGNCDSATVTVTVAAAVIDAIDDSGTTTSLGGTAVANVLANDTVNGATATTGNITLTQQSSSSANVALDTTTGAVAVSGGTSAGNYTLTYRICEQLNPANCDIATVTVVVTPAPIAANDDSAGPIDGTAGATAVIGVLTNDTLGGVQASLATVTLTPNNVAPLTINPDSSVDVAPNTPAGTYTATYQICEIANPGNCDSATVTVSVSAAAIDAIDDSGATTSLGGTAVANVLANDTLNGGAATTSNVVLTQQSTSNPGIALATSTGAVSVAPGTPAGNYTLTYGICEQLNPSNCDTAVAAVTVTAAPIVANDDVAGPVPGATGATAVINVLSNDTLAGAAIDPSLIVLTPNNASPITIGAGGSVDIAPNTPAGSYTATYQICEAANPGNCDSATVTVTVSAAVIDAVDDSGTITSLGGTAVADVLTNDSLNGQPASLATVVLTQQSSSSANVALDTASGAVAVAPNTTAGTYTLTYRICEQLNPANCDTANVTITVTAPVVVANDDAGGPVNGATGATAILDVLANDTLGGAQATLANVVLTPNNVAPITINPNGSVDIAPNTAAGSYTATYQICEVTNPANCDAATVTITVAAAAIDAVDDDARATPVNGTSGGSPIANVLANDTLAGATATTGTVLLSLAGVSNAGLTLDTATGAVSIAAGTAAGTHTLTYRICERLNPNNCDTAVVTVAVSAAMIDAVDDHAGPVEGVSGGNAVAFVLGNDMLNSTACDPAMVTLTSTPAGPLRINGDGSVDVAPRTPAGTYSVAYRICEALNPGNCDTANAIVDVVGDPMALRLSKRAQQRRVKIGDLVRYTLTAENTTSVDAIATTLVDTIPAGFVYVDDSLSVDDGDDAGQLIGTRPLSIAGLDIAAGQQATITYYLRVGAGAGPGIHTNRAIVQDGAGLPVSNEATADVEVAGDPLLEDALIAGTVFDDRNGNGIQDRGERGIPGVRIASVEGLTVETDAFGRYHLVGIDAGAFSRGRLFILKVDPSTLPGGTTFTTENPRVRRITPGLPARFDFGVKLPEGAIGGGEALVDIELGEVLFDRDSARIPAASKEMLDRLAATVREHGGGRLTIVAHADEEALAFRRAQAVQTEIAQRLDTELAAKTSIEVATQVEPLEPLISLEQAIALSNLLFDTDKSTIRTQYLALMSEVARAINRRGRGVLQIDGHADQRGSDDYNLRLGMRRAQAVFEAIASELDPEVRKRMRIEIQTASGAVPGIGSR